MFKNVVINGVTVDKTNWDDYFQIEGSGTIRTLKSQSLDARLAYSNTGHTKKPALPPTKTVRMSR